MDFHGSNAPEKIDVSANGKRLRLFRDVAAITMDIKRCPEGPEHQHAGQRRHGDGQRPSAAPG